MFAHDDVGSRVEDIEQFSNAVEKFLPVLWFDGVTDLGVDVEDRSDDGKLQFHTNTDTQVVRRRNVRQLVQHFNLLTTIRSCEK